MQVGRKEGLSEGLQKGREEGIKEGCDKGILQTAAAALKQGVPLETVAAFTGLPRTRLEELQNFNAPFKIKGGNGGCRYFYEKRKLRHGINNAYHTVTAFLFCGKIQLFHYLNRGKDVLYRAK